MTVIYEHPAGRTPKAGYIDGMAEFLEDEDTRFKWVEYEPDGGADQAN